MTLTDLNREENYTQFVEHQLMPFWQQRQEWQFKGKNNVPIQCVRFTSYEHHKVIVIIAGLMESYIKYQELIYDLFCQGYDAYMYDHRGQGFSGRMLPDPHAVYVDDFVDYVSDLDSFWQNYLSHSRYHCRYLIGHSMGGAITSLFLAKNPRVVNAVVLSVPMTGIKLPLPKPVAKCVISLTQKSMMMRNRYAFKRKTPLPFKLNLSCGSEVRYNRMTSLYYQYPQTQLFGPTFHWVSEAMKASEQVLDNAALITTPLLLLQAGKEQLVDNHSHRLFLKSIDNAGHLATNGGLHCFDEAAHEILFDHDAIRIRAFHQIIDFFSQYQE